jgi:endonuclease/exonuclease/phosphatase family metal-dependent hydrolase
VTLVRPVSVLLASVLTAASTMAGAGLGAVTAPTSVAAPAVVTAPTPVARAGIRSVDVRKRFTLATFNVLGDRHTRGRRDGFASGAARMRHTVRALRGHSVDVVALQEFEDSQWRAFARLTRGGYRVFAHDRQRANAVAWRTRSFRLVRGTTVPIPYFGGNLVQMPVVLLQSRATGQRMYFTSFHNPTTNRKHPGNDRWRARAAAREIALVNSLRRHHRPVFLMGDFNERSQRWHCWVAGATHMVTAGSGYRRAGSCRSREPRRIDWIFGSKGVTFRRYLPDRSRLVGRASDHPMIVVQVR